MTLTSIRAGASSAPPDVSPFDYQRRLDLSDAAAAVLALQRATGMTEAAVTRLLLALIDVSNGRQQFPASFVLVGKRMASKPASDEAHEARCKRDLKVLEAAQERTGYELVKVNRSKKKNQSSTWSLVAVDYLVEIQRRGRAIFSAQRRLTKRDRLGRAECFDYAASELEIQRAGVKPKPSDDLDHDDEKAATIRDVHTIRTLARNVARRFIGHAATPDELRHISECMHAEVERGVEGALLEAHQVPPCDSRTSHRGGVEETGCIPPDKYGGDAPSDTFLGVKTVGHFVPKPQQNPQNDVQADDTSEQAALVALGAFASVGVGRFRVMLKADETGEVETLGVLDVERLRRDLPALLRRSGDSCRSLILDCKPSHAAHVIQVDEADARVSEMLAPLSFLSVETSPGNGQVWLALDEGTPGEVCAATWGRLFGRLKPLGSNRGASGGLRWPGSRNFKLNRRLTDGSHPEVRLLGVQAGRVVTHDELERSGLLAEPTPHATPEKNRHTSPESRPRRVPSYDVAARAVRRKADGAVDRSAVDAFYTVICLRAGFTPEEVVEMLNQVSPKARGRRDGYAERTVAWGLRAA